MEIYKTPGNMAKNPYGFPFMQAKSSIIPPSDDNEMTPCMCSVGYAFVPVQTINEIYPPKEGLEAGTIFPELDKPFGVYGAEVL